MVQYIDAFVQSMFWNFFGVWHGGCISEAAMGDWRELILWVCRECIDGGRRDYARFRNASDMAFCADIDGRDMGAYLRIGGIGGGTVGVEDTPRMMVNDMSRTTVLHRLAHREMPI